MKSLIRQLIEAKTTNNEDAYECVHEEITCKIETLCNSFTENDVDKESIIELADLLREYSERLIEYSDDL
jgi:hypothetical protein